MNESNSSRANRTVLVLRCTLTSNPVRPRGRMDKLWMDEEASQGRTPSLVRFDGPRNVVRISTRGILSSRSSLTPSNLESQMPNNRFTLVIPSGLIFPASFPLPAGKPWARPANIPLLLSINPRFSCASTSTHSAETRGWAELLSNPHKQGPGTGRTFNSDPKAEFPKRADKNRGACFRL